MDTRPRILFKKSYDLGYIEWSEEGYLCIMNCKVDSLDLEEDHLGLEEDRLDLDLDLVDFHLDFWEVWLQVH